MSLVDDSGTSLGHATVSETEQLIKIINDAYAVENGSTGIAFKKAGVSRLQSEDAIKGFQRDVVEGRVLVLRKQSDIDNGDVREGVDIVGCIVYTHKSEENCVFFGPFAVKPEYKGHGYGTLLLEELERMTKEDIGAKQLKLYVVNHREDLIKLYSTKFKFVECGTAQYEDEGVLTRKCHFVTMEKPV